ncbi:MAG TPA: hypothetical protein VI588_00105 [Candidatus Gracilibacteria bacterium]|nr:hypothetical protein [Candidatus Gracilibacteria bacterium]
MPVRFVVTDMPAYSDARWIDLVGRNEMLAVLNDLYLWRCLLGKFHPGYDQLNLWLVCLLTDRFAGTGFRITNAPLRTIIIAGKRFQRFRLIRPRIFVAADFVNDRTFARIIITLAVAHQSSAIRITEIHTGFTA